MQTPEDGQRVVIWGPCQNSKSVSVVSTGGLRLLVKFPRNLSSSHRNPWEAKEERAGLWVESTTLRTRRGP